MDSLTMKALLGQLKGKTVEQQATAANAESWKRTKMIKDIKTYARLNEFVAFAATINAETGDAEMQKAYQTLETALDAAEADSSTLNDAGTISEVIDHVIEAFVKMKKEVTQTASLFDKRQSTSVIAGIPMTTTGNLGMQTGDQATTDQHADKPKLTEIKGMTLTREDFAGKFLRAKVGKTQDEHERRSANSHKQCVSMTQTNATCKSPRGKPTARMQVTRRQPQMQKEQNARA